MLEFLLALLATATVGALLIPLLRAETPSAGRLEGELAIYRDQLAEIERDRASGALSESETAAARLEIERRILAAADVARPAITTSSTLHRLLPPALALAIPLLALGLYLKIGHPGLPAAPFVAGAKPPAAQPMDVARLVAEARALAAQQPNNPEAQSALGEALTLEADGTVAPAAVEAFNKAVALQPNDARSLYYLGLHDAQAGDGAAALKRWQELEAKSPPDAPFLPMLRAEMARVAREAGLPAPAGTAMPQPSREQQDAMAALTPEQRQQAIRGMVEGLAARLKDNPQDRAGWLRLANAWKVLGENASAVDAYAKADALAPVDARILADWAEAHVRGLKPGEPPSPAAVAVLERLEKAEPRNGLALFYLGAASFAAGDKKAAAQRWKTLLALLPADAPIRDMLERRIKETE
ncbi:MAG: c-type cytochrome biogenesis protein CcmI [Reyranella sp.]|nr:c-type cytochrome biogenesis protein CcmI [Reyranella sp.]MBL6651148.1 c-type cytochrome biogenesis protein CcmI [Reyranella sp.]